MKNIKVEDKNIVISGRNNVDENHNSGSFKNKLVEWAVPGWMKRSYEGAGKYMGRNGYLRTGLFLGYMSLQVMTHYWLNQNFFKARSQLDDVLNAPKVDGNEFDKSFMSVLKWVAVWIGFEVIGNLFQAVFRYSLQSAIKTDLNKRFMETGAFNGIKYSLANESIDETTVINVDVNTYVSNVSYLTGAFTMATAAFTLGLKNLKVLLSLPVIGMCVGIIIFMKLLTWTVSGIIRNFNNDITQFSRKAMLINSTVKKSSESIAFVGGEKFELKQLLSSTKQGLEKSVKMAFMGMFLSFVSSWKGFGVFAFGLYLSKDKLISKQMNFSDAIMIGQALESVITYLTWADEQNEWILEHEVAYNRIKELESEISKWELAKKEMAENLKISDSNDKNIIFKGQINKPNGDKLFDGELSMEVGKVYKLDGPTGAGKTTLLRTLAGLWPYVKNATLTRPKAIQFVPQSCYIQGMGISLIDVIKYPRVEGLIEEDRKYVEELLKKFEMEDKIQDLDLKSTKNKEGQEVPVQYDNTLSGGEKQRIALIRALINKPHFLVMDESTSAIDKETKTKIEKVLKEEMKDGVILFIDHNPTNESSEEKKPGVTLSEVQNFGN